MTDRELFERARAMLDMAYVPYSKFKVGACLLTSDGRTFTGCNVENASYGATICAERTAVVKAVSEGATSFKKIAIVGVDAPAWPCGICRQVLYEFSDDLEVVCGAASTGEYEVVKLTDILPKAFGPKDL